MDDIAPAPVLPRAPPITGLRNRGRLAARLAVVVGLALALYGRTVGFGFVYLDDDTLILGQQAFLSRPSSLWRSFARTTFPREGRDHAYYRPVVTASYGLDAQWTGGSPLGYHLTNVGLHACAAGLLFLLLRRLGHTDNIALGGGLLFAAHPALTEAVAWIPGRNDTLLTVFALASWLLLLRCWAPGRWVWPGRIGHLLAWLAALLSKETAVVLPAAFLLHPLLVERRPWRQLLASRSGFWLPLGWVAVLGVYLAARTAVATEGIGTAGLSAGIAHLLGDPVATLALFVGSLGKLVLPVHLSVLAIPKDTWLWPGVLGAGLLLAALLVPRLRPARPQILFGVACFLIFIAPGLPASNLLLLENRLTLPAIGMVFMACAIANGLVGPAGASHAGDGKRAASSSVLATTGVAAVIGVIIAVIIAVLAIVSFVRSGDFRDRLTFCEAAVRDSPHSALAHRNLGVTYQISGREDLALSEYEEALHHDAAEPVVHNNLGVLFMAKGQLVEAEQHLRQELAINPRNADAHNNLALVLRATGRVDEAAQHWEAGLGLNGDNIDAMRALLDYYAPRHPTKAARFRSLLEARGAERPAPPGLPTPP